MPSEQYALYNLFDKKGYIAESFETMFIKYTSRIVSFKQKVYMANITKILKWEQKVSAILRIDFYKLMNNSVFGKIVAWKNIVKNKIRLWIIYFKQFKPNFEIT